MDYSKIFLKEARPTAIGGQAVMGGVMMRGPNRNAIAMRLPGGQLYLRTDKRKPDGKWKKVPLIRGVVAFAASFSEGMRTMMKSADILETFVAEEERGEPRKLDRWIERRFGSRALWNLMLFSAVAAALIVSIGLFVIFPTLAVHQLKRWIASAVLLNLIEGVLRIVMFIGYVLMIRNMEDIKTLFRYHGAEHKTIHCYENGLELTPENAGSFYTLHPRCGTSFIIFVFIISLLLFSVLGWPDMALRILSRLLFLPVIAGVSYEFLRWAGRSDNIAVRVLSRPGLMMQRLTTAEPTPEQLEVAIVSLKAVLVDEDYPELEGFCDADANITTELEDINI